MQGLLGDKWVEIEKDADATFWIGSPTYYVTGDESGQMYDESEFDEIDETA